MKGRQEFTGVAGFGYGVCSIIVVLDAEIGEVLKMLKPIREFCEAV